MAKKQVGVSLRKPPPAEQDAFVSGESAAAPSKRESSIVAKPIDVTLDLSNGDRVRELTVYLPQDLARKLAIHCVEQDRDQSKLLAELVDRHLAVVEGKPVPSIEEPQWQRVFRTLQTILRARFGLV